MIAQQKASTSNRGIKKHIITLIGIMLALTICPVQAQEPRAYTTDEIELVPKIYLGADQDVAGTAKFLHGIPQLIKLVEGKVLSGDGIIVAIWDGGLVQAEHQDFNTNQVLHKDPQKAQLFLDNHATHVAGTIAGNGSGRPEASGMAPGSLLWSFDFYDDIAEMKKQAADASGISVSNHSYGFQVGWSDLCREKVPGSKDRIVWIWAGAADDIEDRGFGQYDDNARDYDRLALENPTWTQVVSAGNTRNLLLDPHNALKRLPALEQYDWLFEYDISFHGEYFLWSCGESKKSDPHQSNLADGGGFDTLPHGNGIAKNVITVGAMIDPDPDEAFDPVTGNFLPIPLKQIKTTIFSSWGPTDDGRIKPDIIANGQKLIATAIPKQCDKKPGCKPADVVSDNANYVRMSGTSMAAPVVTGALALLNELSIQMRKGARLRSDEAKALLIHTARSPYDGPDYRIGWGSIQADQAGMVLIGNGPGEHLKMVSVEKSDKPLTLKLKRAGGRQGRITLVWLDEPGKPEYGLDIDKPRLVNDLDMRLIPPGADEAQAVLPWKLDHRMPSAPAIRGKNARDNIERIDVPDVPYSDGIWMLVIQSGNWPTIKKQEAALAIWGFDFFNQ